MKITFLVFVVRVECTPSDMEVTFLFGLPFEGRVYATGNSQACFELGNRQNTVVLRIPIGSTCGTIEEVSQIIRIFLNKN